MCECCPRAMPTATSHKNLVGVCDNFIVVNHLEGMTPTKIIQAAKEAGATQDEKYFVLFGDFGADPELYTKEQIAQKCL